MAYINYKKVFTSIFNATPVAEKHYLNVDDDLRGKTIKFNVDLPYDDPIGTFKIVFDNEHYITTSSQGDMLAYYDHNDEIVKTFYDRSWLVNSYTFPDKQGYVITRIDGELSFLNRYISYADASSNDELQKEIEDLTALIDDQKARLNAQNTRINTLETMVNSLTTRVGNLETNGGNSGNNEELTARVEAVENDVEGLTLRVDAIEGAVDGLISKGTPLSVGDNLKGKTIYFNTSYSFLVDDDQFRSIDFANGCSISAPDPNVLVFADEEEQLIQMFYDTSSWLVSSYTFPDDQDYIITNIQEVGNFISQYIYYGTN